MANNCISRIKERLEDERNKNNIEINILNEKIRLLERSSLDSKITLSFAISLFPWIITTMLSPLVLKFGLIPLELCRPLFVSLPVSIGAVTNYILEKKHKIKERLSKFTHAKTDKEKLEEEVHYEILREKLKIDNKILERSLEELELEGQYKGMLLGEDVVSCSLDIADINKKMELLQNELEKKSEQLDIVVKKCMLKKLFKAERSKSLTKYDSVSFGGMAAFFTMATYNIPLIGATAFHMQAEASLLGTFLPFFVGGFGGGYYFLKRAKKRREVFKSINDELEDEKIKELIDDDVLEDYEQEKNNIMRDIYILRLEYEKKIQELEFINNKSELEEKKKLDYHYELEMVDKMLASCDMVDSLDNINTNEEEKGKSLVLRKYQDKK